jgi:phosphoenolpyruvate synthase/pyruvate phosphate dikinase
MEFDSMYVRWFGDLNLDDRSSVGGKGASLGELTRAGIRVPPGFVVTTAAFETALAALDPAAGIRAAIERLDAGDLDAVSKISEAIRARFAAAELPPDLLETVAQAYAALAGAGTDGAVAVRSSATSEDSADASFAGLQDTHLCVRGAQAVFRSLCACWSSLYSRESVIYRLRLGLPERHVAMGVVVQRMLESRSSGVMFTRSPLTGDRSVITIEAGFGLGSALVGGEVTPDKYVVAKVTGDIVKRTVSAKTVRHVSAACGGVRVEALEGALQLQPALSDEEIHALAEIGKRVEQHYGNPQDIEWAIAADEAGRDQLYLLQSRPETVWSRRDAEPVAQPAARAYDHVLAALGGLKR